jgi:hypothetical protein
MTRLNVTLCVATVALLTGSTVAGNIEPWVEPHEEAALVSLVLVEAVGLLSLVTLWAHRRQPEVRHTTVVAIAPHLQAAQLAATIRHIRPRRQRGISRVPADKPTLARRRAEGARWHG